LQRVAAKEAAAKEAAETAAKMKAVQDHAAAVEAELRQMKAMQDHASTVEAELAQVKKEAANMLTTLLKEYMTLDQWAKQRVSSLEANLTQERLNSQNLTKESQALADASRERQDRLEGEVREVKRESTEAMTNLKRMAAAEVAAAASRVHLHEEELARQKAELKAELNTTLMRAQASDSLAKEAQQEVASVRDKVASLSAASVGHASSIERTIERIKGIVEENEPEDGAVSLGLEAQEVRQSSNRSAEDAEPRPRPRPRSRAPQKLGLTRVAGGIWAKAPEKAAEEAQEKAAESAKDKAPEKAPVPTPAAEAPRQGPQGLGSLQSLEAQLARLEASANDEADSVVLRIGWLRAELKNATAVLERKVQEKEAAKMNMEQQLEELRMHMTSTLEGDHQQISQLEEALQHANEITAESQMTLRQSETRRQQMATDLKALTDDVAAAKAQAATRVSTLEGQMEELKAEKAALSENFDRQLLTQKEKVEQLRSRIHKLSEAVYPETTPASAEAAGAESQAWSLMRKDILQRGNRTSKDARQSGSRSSGNRSAEEGDVPDQGNEFVDEMVREIWHLRNMSRLEVDELQETMNGMLEARTVITALNEEKITELEHMITELRKDQRKVFIENRRKFYETDDLKKAYSKQLKTLREEHDKIQQEHSKLKLQMMQRIKQLEESASAASQLKSAAATQLAASAEETSSGVQDLS